MARTIENIKVISNKYSTTVYIDFTNQTFGMRINENGKWRSVNLSDEELTEAKKLAVVNGKWTNWKAPRKVNTPKFAPKMAEDDAEIEEAKTFKAHYPEEHPDEPKY